MNAAELGDELRKLRLELDIMNQKAILSDEDHIRISQIQERIEEIERVTLQAYMDKQKGRPFN